MSSTADAIFEMAFDPRSMRNPRSLAYKRGVKDALYNAERADNDPLITLPYVEGTAEADAWYSGNNEGRQLARKWSLYGHL